MLTSTPDVVGCPAQPVVHHVGQGAWWIADMELWEQLAPYCVDSGGDPTLHQLLNVPHAVAESAVPLVTAGIRAPRGAQTAHLFADLVRWAGERSPNVQYTAVLVDNSRRDARIEITAITFPEDVTIGDLPQGLCADVAVDWNSVTLLPLYLR